MIHVVFPLKCRDIGSSKCASALVAEQTKPTEVVCLAEGILAPAILIIGREEFGSDYLTAVLQDISMIREALGHGLGFAVKLTLHLKQSR